MYITLQLLVTVIRLCYALITETALTLTLCQLGTGEKHSPLLTHLQEQLSQLPLYIT